MAEAKMSAPAEDVSAYEKAAQDGGADPRCIPIKLTGPVPEDQAITYPPYSAEDQETWQILFSRQAQLHVNRACKEYFDGLNLMHFSPDRIPALKECSKVLTDTVGWTVARIPGLLNEHDFFSFMARRVFPSTDYIRPKKEIDYTPAPDLFHDIFGHMPVITNPFFADFFQMISQASLNATGLDRRRVERFYWFTVEFGLIRQADGMRIYGAGILSSPGEVVHALTPEVEVVDYHPEKLAQQEYDVWHMQPKLFAIESFEQLVSEFRDWAKLNKLLN